MRHKVTRELFNYWSALKGARSVPRRSEVDPGKIRALLPYVYILDASERSSVRFRLAGTELCNCYRIELRGTNMLLMWQDRDYAEMTALVDRVRATGRGARVEYVAETNDGDTLALEMLLLALAQDDGAVTRLFGSVVPLARPHWLGERNIVHQRIERVEFLEAVQNPVADTATITARTAGAPHLRLIKR